MAIETQNQFLEMNMLPAGMEAMFFLRRYGSIEQFEGRLGDKITILPTCSVPIDYLDRTNWRKKTQMGNFRDVWSIDSLDNDIRPGLVVKSPERVFSAKSKVSENKDIWWGGPKSGERAISIGINHTVELQTVWEAIILLELTRHGIYVEEPQAIIQKKDMSRILVVKEIPNEQNRVCLVGENLTQILLYIKQKTGLLPVDATDYNCIQDLDGRNILIDVNRWEWPPYSDRFRSDLNKMIIGLGERHHQKMVKIKV